MFRRNLPTWRRPWARFSPTWRAEWAAGRERPLLNRLDRPRRQLAAALAALAGYVDAVGFLSADRYFVSFMSGNTTRMATDLVADAPRAILPGLLIAGFVAGVAAGGLVGDAAGNHRKPAVLLLVTVLLANAAAAGRPVPTLAALVLAMGALNNAVKRDEGPVALTYLTGALVRVGQGLADRIAGRGRRGDTGPFVLLWLALAAGAATGAASHHAFGFVALVPATLLCGVLARWSWRIAETPGRG